MPLIRLRRLLEQSRRRRIQRSSTELNLRYRWCLPEFRALTDDEFYAMTSDARLPDRSASPWSFLVLPLGGAWAGAILLSCAVLIAAYDYGELSLWMLLVALVPSVIGVIIPAFVIGVWQLRRAAQREVLAVFIPTNCPSCRFEILGIAPTAGEVICPECGGRTNTFGRHWAAERAKPGQGSVHAGKHGRRRGRAAR